MARRDDGDSGVAVQETVAVDVLNHGSLPSGDHQEDSRAYRMATELLYHDR